MYVFKADDWNKRILPLEKFFFERIIQRCDSQEIISNRHRTVTGYIQVKELIKLCELTFKRDRTVRTLITLIDEAKSSTLNQNISNEEIINKYFIDLKKFILNTKTDLFLKGKEADLNIIKGFLHQLKIFEAQLDQVYYSVLTTEILKIDYKKENEFQRTADVISSLIDLYIPYLVFKGYSITSISEVLKKWIKNYSPSPQRVIQYFNFQEKKFSFLIDLGIKSKEVGDFTDLLFETYSELKIVKPLDLDTNFIDKEKLPAENVVVKFTCDAIDPHSQIRDSYDKLLKRTLIRRERPSLHAFNNFFDRCYWGFAGKKEKLQKILLEHDAINVNSRESTLRLTLTKSSPEYGWLFSDSDFLYSENQTLEKTIYYYNLALGSKSIESSLSLLWTSLETILPYRVASSDIESVQSFVSKSLSIGALGRDIYSFAKRFVDLNEENNNALDFLIDDSFLKINTAVGLAKWFDWFNDGKSKEKVELMTKISNLLTYQFTKIGRPLSEGTLSFIYQRIKASEESIKFQLQRIYLHRNQIVHAGDLVSEYTNLWIHLEWYVGKLIAYAVMRLELKKEDKTLESIFIELESEHNYLLSYLESNRNKKIQEAGRIIPILFKETWQVY